jgi:putative oxidoreductase
MLKEFSIISISTTGVSMFSRIVRTTDDTTLTVLRVVLGVVMFAHAAQKVLGWFGGRGFAATMQFFTIDLGIPGFFAFLAIVSEFFGSLALILGLMSRVASLAIIVIMIFAVALVTGVNGFFMNWFGKLSPGAEGYEYHLMAVAMGIAVMVRGGGAFSIDALLSRRLNAHVTRSRRQGVAV